MTYLLIDAGNSRFKYALMHDHQLSDVLSVDHNNQQDIAGILTCFDIYTEIEAVYISNVAGNRLAQAFDEYFESRGITPQYATSQRKFGGLVNAYINANQLGVDRWLAMIAINDCFSEPFCVADCGTAITIDAIGVNGRHLGGLILPGMSLMQKSINSQTDAINIVELDDSPGLFGTSTQQAVSAGITHSIGSLIDNACEALQKDTDCKVQCILTGGDALRLQKCVTVSSIVEKDLVLKGLAIYFGLTQ